jgi:uncharacterized membrane protein YeaQ/YmgE (transglycosylase-associated protein family)
MDITLGEIVIWLIVGALAGSFTGALITRKKKGLGRWTNFGIGLVGAVIGGGIFDVFDIDLGLGEINVSFEDLIAAFLGSLIFLFVVWLFRKRWRRKA